MKIKFVKLISLFLSIVLALALTGCKNSSEQTSSGFEIITEEEIVYVENNASANNSSSNDNSSNNNSSDEIRQEVIDYDTPILPDYYSGKTVKFAVTSDPMQSEKAYVINNFEKHYGIKIEPVIISGDYVNGLKALIAAGNAPDVTRSSGDFPLALSYLQSLDAAQLDYSNPIWEQGMFELTKFNGSPYLCTTQGNVYTEVDIVVYRKDILASAGCKTPEQYDAEGNWNIDAFFEIARECVKKVSGVKGCSFVNYDSALHMSGNAVFKLENGKFVNGINNSVTNVATKIFNAKKEGIVFTDSTNGVAKGEIAIATHHSYALRKTGAFEKYEEVWDKLGYYYLPSFENSNKSTKTGLVRGWGLVRDAKNPVAAGLFLEYYLDPNNCDVKNMYISQSAETFFFRATDIDYNYWNPYYTYSDKNEGIAQIDFRDDIYNLISTYQAQFDAVLPKINEKINKACENLNSFVAQETYTY